ncbi:MAG: anaerobic ribonucleoside-triphosphate reductase activating protein [Clostridiales bacterium]|nr:anaerobic ribonucleoside-triphosphate reductase activating protein [Clostridiales bacterium]
MNVAEIKSCDIANGPGVRVSLFVSGCPHHCLGCFNEEAWDFDYGVPFTGEKEDEILRFLSPDYIEGLTLLGGEPMDPRNQAELLPFIRRVRAQFPKKTIWCFTGYDFDRDILGRMMKTEVTRQLVSMFDVMVDGPFVIARKNLSLQFRGSENQRILDVPRSLAEGRGVWVETYRK